MVDRRAFQFFIDHAGGIVGERAKGAIRLARAEQLLERAVDLGVASVEWRDDDCEPYDPGDSATAEEAARYFGENTWTGPFGCVVQCGELYEYAVSSGRESQREHLASLWSIVVGPRGTDDPYCRVVVAELACELEDELRQAVGDALDARLAVHA